MKVIEYIRVHGLDSLTKEFGIKVKEYEEQGLFVLNYDQITSPKMDAIVQECRGLIIDKNMEVVCRPFDRFFNYGEAETDKVDLTGYVYQPKLDGSLIKVYHWNGSWRIATRGTAFAESDVGGWGITFETLALKAMGFETLGQFDVAMEQEGMPRQHTFLLELTAMENRVVTNYQHPSMTLLAVRHNDFGGYIPISQYDTAFWKVNNFLHSLTIQEILDKAEELKNLEEGFVGYDKSGVPRVKVKSSKYVVVHHIRGEGLNPKRIAELVISGEQEEYLTYFPEDRKVISPYAAAMEEMLGNMEDAMLTYQGIDDQKAFAIAIQGVYGKYVLFTARKHNISIREAFHCGKISAKVDTLLNFMKES